MARGVMVLLKPFKAIKQGKNTFEWIIPLDFYVCRDSVPYLLFVDFPDQKVYADSWYVTNDSIVGTWDVTTDLPFAGIAHAPVYRDHD